MRSLLFCLLLWMAPFPCSADNGVALSSLEIKNQEAVVRIEVDKNYGTAACITPSGVFLTAKHIVEHVKSKEALGRYADGRTIDLNIFWESGNLDGPVFLKPDEPLEDHPFVRLADHDMEVHDVVYAIGFPKGNLTATQGTVLEHGRYNRVGSKFFEDNDGPLLMTKTTLKADPGFSGGPVLNTNDEIVGMVVGGGWESMYSLVIPQRPLATAAQLSRSYRGGTMDIALWVFTSSSCLPCKKFKDDYANDVDGLRSTLTKYGTVRMMEEGPMIRKMGIQNVPSFVVMVNNMRYKTLEGYTTAKDLLARLRALVPQEHQEDLPEEFNEPNTVEPKLPMSPSPEVEEQSLAVDWTGATIVLLIAKRDTTANLIGLSAGSWQRILERMVSEHTGASVLVLSELAEPDKYASLTKALDIQPEKGYILIGVPKTNQGLAKGLVVRSIEQRVGDKLETYHAPVEIIFERVNNSAYQTLRSVVETTEAPKSPLSAFQFTGNRVLDLILAALCYLVFRTVGYDTLAMRHVLWERFKKWLVGKDEVAPPAPTPPTPTPPTPTPPQ